VAGQVFKGRRTSLRAGSASQVFAGSRTASEDKEAGHGPGGSSRVGHAFKIGGRAKARRRVRFPSASATENAPLTAAFRRRARGRPRGRPDPGPNDRLHHTSLSVFPPPGAGQVFRPTAGGPDKSSAAVLSNERWERHGLLPLDDRWRGLPSCWLLRPTPRPSCRRRARTRTGAPRAPRHQCARGSSRRRTPRPARPGICTPCAGSSSDLQSGSPTVDRSSWRTLYASRALCQPLRVHRIGPLVCSPATSEPTGVPASTRRTSHPALHGPSSLGARAARRGNRPASARPDYLDRRRTQERASRRRRGTQDRLDLIRRAQAEGLEGTRRHAGRLSHQLVEC
jgi:hypothetical protein